MRLPSLTRFRRTHGATEVGPIGLDLGSDRLRMLQMEGDVENFRVRAFASSAYPVDRDAILADPSGLKSLVASALRSQPFRGKKVVTILPGDAVKLMLLNYELAPQQSEPELIMALVEERIQESTDEWVVDYHPIRPRHEKQSELSALVAIAREDVVIRHLERLHMAGLEVEALEIAPLAIRRLVTRLSMQDFEEDVMILHFGHHKSHLTVLWGRRLILYREIDFGQARAIEQVAKSLDLPLDSAASLLLEFGVFPQSDGESTDRASSEISETVMEILTPGFSTVSEQIGNALVYTASRTRGESVDLIYLTGGAVAEWPGVDRLICSLASIEARVLQPLQSITENSTTLTGESTSSVTLAAGLALRGFGENE